MGGHLKSIVYTTTVENVEGLRNVRVAGCIVKSSAVLVDQQALLVILDNKRCFCRKTFIPDNYTHTSSKQSDIRKFIKKILKAFLSKHDDKKQTIVM